jgi:AraC-like DNA-binding protein
MMEIFHEKGQREVTLRYAVFGERSKRFHWHERIELVIPRDAPFSVLADGERYEVKQGDVILIGKNKIHAFATRDGDAGVLLAQFPYRLLLRGDTLPQDVRVVIRAEEIAADAELSAEFFALYDLLVRELDSGRDPANPFTLSLFSALYFLLMRHFAVSDDTGREKKEKEDFYRVVSYVNDHFTEAVTVGSVAKALYIDRGKLSRLFSVFAGVSLTDYINSLRIARAGELIKAGRPITEAALDSGFQSVRTFHDVYRRMTGTTPRNLKK